MCPVSALRPNTTACGGGGWHCASPVVTVALSRSLKRVFQHQVTEQRVEEGCDPVEGGRTRSRFCAGQSTRTGHLHGRYLPSVPFSLQIPRCHTGHTRDVHRRVRSSTATGPGSHPTPHPSRRTNVGGDRAALSSPAVTRSEVTGASCHVPTPSLSHTAGDPLACWWL